jgi:hypothetical protein
MKQYKVVALNSRTEALIDQTLAKDKIYDRTGKMEKNMEDLHKNLCDITKNVEEDIIKQYQEEMLEAQKEFKE